MRALRVIAAMFCLFVAVSPTFAADMPGTLDTGIKPPTSRLKHFTWPAFWTFDRNGNRVSYIDSFSFDLIESISPAGNLITNYSVNFYHYNNTWRGKPRRGGSNLDLYIYLLSPQGRVISNRPVIATVPRDDCTYGHSDSAQEDGEVPVNWIDVSKIRVTSSVPYTVFPC